MRIYFLGREKSTRSYTRQYFYVFFGVVKPTRKSDTLKHSSLSFKLHKNERPEKEKRVLRICSFVAVVHWVIFELGIRFTWVGSSLPPSHDYFLEFILRRLVTLPVIHGVWCLFRRVNVAESYYLISQLAWKLSALTLTRYPVLRTNPPCVSPTLIITSSTLVSCRLMEDTSRPPFDRFLPVDLNTLSRNEI